MTIKLKVENVSKIFGPRPKSVIPMVEKGECRKQKY